MTKPDFTSGTSETDSLYRHKFYLLVAMFALSLGSITAILTLQAFVNDGIRVYVNSEGVWAKAQKEAVIALTAAVATRDKSIISKYENAIKVPMGYRSARETLSSDSPDFDIAERGFVEGTLDPLDIPTAIQFFYYFQQFPYVRDAIQIWSDADKDIAELNALKNTLQSSSFDIQNSVLRAEFLDTLGKVDQKLTQHELQFSETLAEGGRRIASLLQWLTLLVLILSVGSTAVISLTLIRAFNRLYRRQQYSQMQTDLALTSADITTMELDLSRDQLTVTGGKHPSLPLGATIQVKEALSKFILSKSEREGLQEVLYQDNASVSYRAKYDGWDTPRWVSLVSGEAFERDGQLYRLFVRIDGTEVFEANEQLRIAAERQKEMFAVIGHELRTPVASIVMLVDDEDLEENQKLRLIKDTSVHLLSVLEDLRIVVAPERIKELIQVDENPAELVRRAVGPLQTYARENQKNLKLLLPQTEIGTFSFSAQAVRQLATNLVKNAIVHSVGDSVWVRLDVAPTATGVAKASLTVEDNGEGIPSDQIDQLFEPFTRGNTSADGTGLGLHIAKELSESINGSLRYEQSRHGGAAFIATFEMRERPKPSAGGEASNAPMLLSGLRVLLAEDDRMLRMLTVKQLEKAGATVVAGEDGAKALEAYVEGEFDCVVTDIMMPKMDGYELSRALRSKGCKIPIIAVTAAVVGKETDDILVSGASGFIPKPFTLEKFSSMLMKAQQDD